MILDSREIVTFEDDDTTDSLVLEEEGYTVGVSEILEDNQNIIVGEQKEEFVNYKANGHETLILIAYEFYSDYRKWKDISKDNEDIFAGDLTLKKDMIIKLRKPLNPSSSPKGRPYIIRKDETLSIISAKVYGDEDLWPAIYKNNREQIRFPNLIFPGFTIFYPEIYGDKNLEVSFMK
jgi:hypothetical protein